MKIKLMLSKSEKEQFMSDFEKGKIEFGEDGNYLLIQKHTLRDSLILENKEGEKINVAFDEIYFFESNYQSILAHTKEGTCYVKEKMHVLEAMLYEYRFLRIHHSYIVNLKKIKRIRPSLNMKFVLFLEDGSSISVSRTYYYRFKEEMGF